MPWNLWGPLMLSWRLWKEHPCFLPLCHGTCPLVRPCQVYSQGQKFLPSGQVQSFPNISNFTFPNPVPLQVASFDSFGLILPPPDYFPGGAPASGHLFRGLVKWFPSLTPPYFIPHGNLHISWFVKLTNEY